MSLTHLGKDARFVSPIDSAVASVASSKENSTLCYANIGAESEKWRDYYERFQGNLLASAWRKSLEQLIGSGRLRLRQKGEGRTMIAWLNSKWALKVARSHGARLWGQEPSVVRALNDKASTQRFVSSDGAPSLIFDGTVLHAQEWWTENTQKTVELWRELGVKELVAKPRFGTSGQGWIRLKRDALAPSFVWPERLREAGVVVEARYLDVASYSAHFWLHEDRSVEFLGCIAQNMRGAHVAAFPLSHRALTHEEKKLLCTPKTAQTWEHIAQEFVSQGYFGPLGIDCMSGTINKRLIWRPCNEVNARFTVGLVWLFLQRQVDS